MDTIEISIRVARKKLSTNSDLSIIKRAKNLGIVSYGTTLEGFLYPNLKLTGTKKSDKRNNRTNYQSWNMGKNHITQSFSYTNVTKKSSYFRLKDFKGSILTTPCIMISSIDRIIKSYGLSNITSRERSLHHCEKHNKEVIPLSNTMGTINIKHKELIVNTKKGRLNVITHIILPKKLLTHYKLSEENIRQLFGIPDSIKILFDDSCLYNNIPIKETYLGNLHKCDFRILNMVLNTGDGNEKNSREKRNME